MYVRIVKLSGIVIFHNGFLTLSISMVKFWIVEQPLGHAPVISIYVISFKPVVLVKTSQNGFKFYINSEQETLVFVANGLYADLGGK